MALNIKNIDENTRHKLMIASMIIMLILESLLLAKESVLFNDGANKLFNLITTGDFSYLRSRYGMLPSQVLPLLAVKAGMNTIGIIYLQSISFNLYYIILILLVWVLYRDIHHALLIFALFLFSSMDLHFVKDWEIFFACAFTLFFSAHLKNKYRPAKISSHLILSAIILLAVYTHPACLPFLLILLIYHHRKLKIKVALTYSVLTTVLVLISMTDNSYEVSNIKRSFAAITDFCTSAHFLKYFVFKFPVIVTVLLIASTIGSVKIRRASTWLVSLVIIAFLARALNFINSHVFHPSHFFYFEGALLIPLFSISYICLDKLSERRYFIPVFFTILILRYLFIVSVPNNFTRNIEDNEKAIVDLVEEYPDKRLFIMARDNSFIERTWADYLYFKESYIVSSYMLDHTIAIYMTDDSTSYLSESGTYFKNNKPYKEEICESQVEGNIYYIECHVHEDLGFMHLKDEDIVKVW